MQKTARQLSCFSTHHSAKSLRRQWIQTSQLTLKSSLVWTRTIWQIISQEQKLRWNQPLIKQTNACTTTECRNDLWAHRMSPRILNSTKTLHLAREVTPGILTTICRPRKTRAVGSRKDPRDGQPELSLRLWLPSHSWNNRASSLCNSLRQRKSQMMLGKTPQQVVTVKSLCKQILIGIQLCQRWLNTRVQAMQPSCRTSEGSKTTTSSMHRHTSHSLKLRSRTLSLLTSWKTKRKSLSWSERARRVSSGSCKISETEWHEELRL